MGWVRVRLMNAMGKRANPLKKCLWISPKPTHARHFQRINILPDTRCRVTEIRYARWCTYSYTRERQNASSVPDDVDRLFDPFGWAKSCSVSHCSTQCITTS